MKIYFTKAFITIILMLTFSSAAFSVDRVISGVVKSASDGDVISGATITLKGTEKSTLSNFDGIFELIVPEYATELLVSYPGMKDLQYSIPALGNAKVEIKMTKGKSGGRVMEESYENKALTTKTRLKPNDALFLNYSGISSIGIGADIGYLNKVGFFLSGTYAVDAETVYVGGAFLFRNGSYGTKKRAGFYTFIQSGFELDGYDGYYVGLGEIFDFGWFHLTLSAGYCEATYYNYYNSGYYDYYDYNYYDYPRYEDPIYDFYQGLYVGFGLGFNFGL